MGTIILIVLDFQGVIVPTKLGNPVWIPISSPLTSCPSWRRRESRKNILPVASRQLFFSTNPWAFCWWHGLVSYETPHEVLGDTSRGLSSYMPHICLNKICFAVSPAPERNQEVCSFRGMENIWKTYVQPKNLHQNQDLEHKKTNVLFEMFSFRGHI